MLDVTDKDLTTQVDEWLEDFQGALAAGASAELASLFVADGYWRDVLAFTWRITTVHGAKDIVAALGARAADAHASAFTSDCGRTPPRRVTRAGTECIEAFFAFTTASGRCYGIVRLVPDTQDDDRLQAWTLLTALDALHGFEETVGRARPSGDRYARDFRGPNWQDLRDEAVAYQERDPTVLVVGGGQAGLCIAARLAALGVDTLIIDSHPRVGDNWRQRYHALVLHNQVQVNHLPYMPFPPTWPTYIPKDKLASWFEAYAEAMELNFWTSTTLTGGRYDEAAGCWTVQLSMADGSNREMRPRHVVMATGVSGIPKRPEIPGLDEFSGTLLHSGEYGDATPWVGRKALVLGTGNSGHDIAQDLASNGASVTMVQRSPTLIVNVEPSAQLPYALYDEGPPLEDCDLITTSMPFELGRKAHRAMTRQAEALDKELLTGLEKRGFRLSSGNDGTGWQYLYLTRGGGYYFNVGCSDLIVNGEVGLIQHDDIDRYCAEGARLKNGDVLEADLIVLATGYEGQEALVRKLFGDAVAERTGPVWGFGEDDELRNMYQRTPQPGLWFIAGSLAQCRIFSKYLALQIKAMEEGVIGTS